MQKAFGDFLQQNNLLPEKGKVILAVSGGADSVVMAHLFHRNEIPAVMAHCNFHLRAGESDGDERFVRALGQKLKTEVLVRHFDTKAEVENRGGSVQMVARDLRFEWFDKLLEKEEYAVVATGHHLDDQIETFFINLLRGTGISGLRSILPKQGKVIHPMLFASGNEIEEFAEKEDIEYRNDSSNDSLKYQRNTIRHKLIPVLAELEPAFREVFKANFNLLRGAEQMLKSYTNEVMQKCTYQKNDQIFIEKAPLKKTESGAELLSFYLAGFNFHRNTAISVYQNLDALSGKKFYSPSHRLLNDRKYLILEPLQNELPQKDVRVEKGTGRIEYPLTMQFQKQPFTSDLVISSDKNIAMLDYDKLEFPLTIRPWKEGDSFHPLGMDGRKKVSDFFIDNKFSIPEKEKAYLLLSGRKIVWIIGQRIDHRFRITGHTKQVLRIELFGT